MEYEEALTLFVCYFYICSGGQNKLKLHPLHQKRQLFCRGKALTERCIDRDVKT